MDLLCRIVCLFVFFFLYVFSSWAYGIFADFGFIIIKFDFLEDSVFAEVLSWETRYWVFVSELY